MTAKGKKLRAGKSYRYRLIAKPIRSGQVQF